MSHDEVQRSPHRRVLLTKKTDPFLTMGFAVSVGAGSGILYKVAIATSPASHLSLAITGAALVIMGGLLLFAGGWRTFRP